MPDQPPMLPSRLRLDRVQPYQIPQFERTGFLRLDINENPCGAAEFVVQAVQQALGAQELATYPVYADWHRAAAAYFGVAQTDLTCTAGGDEAIKAICEAYLLPNTALLTVEPGYDMFKIWAQLYDNPLRGVALDAQFELDEVKWLAAVQADDVGLVALVVPNNPTGTLVSRELIEKTLQLARCPVVIDETYGEFVDRSVADLIAHFPTLFIVRSFSKVHSLAGLRAGAVLSQPQNIAGLRCVLNPFNVNRAAIAGSLAVLANPDHCRAHVREIGENRSKFVQDLAQMDIECGPSHANFVLVHLGARAGLCTQQLETEGILIRDRSNTHALLCGWCRIAIGSAGQMARTIAALRKVILPPPQLDALIFDLDGPLVDVSGSYRQAIIETAKHFLGAAGASAERVAAIDSARVEEIKRQSGLNNDWICTQALLDKCGLTTPIDEIITYFQSIYWGTAADGLIAREPFRAGADTRTRVGGYATAIVTGRPRAEALWTLQHNGANTLWHQVIAMEDAPPKPSPIGIWQALDNVSGARTPEICTRAAYLGDSVDDMRAATAAGVVAIGILPASATWGDGLAEALALAGASVIFRSVDAALDWLEREK